MLIPGVHGRRPADRREHGQGVGEVVLVVETTRDAGDVVVTQEGVGHEVREELVVTAEGVGEFVEVVVVERTPDRLPQLVLCDRIEVAVPHERGVVAVDHLAHQVRVRVPRANPISDLRPELRGHGVGGVEPPCRGTPVEPVVHHRGNVINYGRAGVVGSATRWWWPSKSS